MELKENSAKEIKSLVNSLKEGIIVVENHTMIYQNKISE